MHVKDHTAAEKKKKTTWHDSNLSKHGTVALGVFDGT